MTSTERVTPQASSASGAGGTTVVPTTAGAGGTTVVPTTAAAPASTVSASTGATSTGPRTTVPRRTARPGPPPAPRPLGVLRAGDLLSVFGALVAAASMTALLWTQIGLFSGIVGYVVVTWCLFVAFYAALVSMTESGPTVRDRVSAVVVQSLGALVLLVLGFVIIYTASRGWKAFVHWNFYTQDLRSTAQLDPLTKGGVFHAIVGTLIEVGIAMAISIPFGLLAAVFLHEVPGAFARFVRTVVNAMTALPDVLAGLFIYATMILILGLGFSGLAAGVALAVTTLPIICRAADVVLSLVPGGLTEASYVLGSGQWATVRLVTLPTARSGLATAVILGAARAIGETAPVLLTAGQTTFIHVDPRSGPMMSLPLLAYTLASSPFPNMVTRGFGAATVLLVLVVALFMIARAIGGRGPGQLSAGQQRRRAARSRRDLARYERRAMRRVQISPAPGPGAVA